MPPRATSSLESPSRPPWKWLAFVFFVGLIINVVCVLFWSQGTGPPKDGDGPDYDSIGYNLAAGRGFGNSFGDPEYRAPYEASAQRERYEPLLAQQGDFEPTAYRPPGLPLVLAGIYSTIGRSFLAWRLLNAVIVTLAMTLTAWLGWRLGGPRSGHRTGSWVAGVGFAEPVVKTYAGRVLTEGPCLLGMVCLAWCLVLAVEHRGWRGMAAVALAGLSAGVLVLTRSIFVLWYPFLCVFVAVMWWRGTRADRRRDAGDPRRPPGAKPRRSSIVAAMAAASFFGIAACLPPLPWWVRNCVVLESFMPLGTQGGIGLPGGYSDVAYENGGAWVNVKAEGFFEPLRAEILAQVERDGTTLSPIMWEREMARYGTARALDWIRDDPVRTGVLVLKKFKRLWTGNDSTHGLVMLVIGIFGWRRIRRRPATAVPWLLIIVNTVVVSLTYSAGGRFVVPVLPMLHIVAVLGGVELAEQRSARRAKMRAARNEGQGG